MDIDEILLIIDKARTGIVLAIKCRDSRKRDKQIKEAKLKAQELIEPFEAEIKYLCNFENNGMDDLFSWGFIEDDLDKVYNILSEIDKNNRNRQLIDQC